MLGLKRRRPTDNEGNPLADPYTVGITPRIALWAPMGNIAPSEQVGRYGGARPTQIPSNWPSAQLKCGVEGIDTAWQVRTDSDTPYFLQTQQLNFPRVTLRVGNRPGEEQGPATVAQQLGGARQARAESIQTLAAGLLGW